MAVGIRETKKARTAQALQDAALRLFAERRFENTTIADLAAEADISPRTFFAYFPSKEAVLFGDFEASFASLATRLHDREPGESAVDALRAWVLTLVETQELTDEREIQRRRIVAEHEALLSYERTLTGRFERVLAEAVAADLGERPSSLRPRLVAAAATAALMALRPDPDLPPLPAERALERLDEALIFLRGGLAALASARGPGPA